MTQTISCKLKLNLTPEQKLRIDELCIAYRNGLNYVSQIAFDNGKTSSNSILQKLTYKTLREEYKLGSQASCNVPRDVASKYKQLWTNFGKWKEHKKKGWIKGNKGFTPFEKPVKYSSRTMTLSYNRDYSFSKDNLVSIPTLQGRIKVAYTGWNKHIDYIKNEDIGAGKYWYDITSKQYYLIVSVNIECQNDNLQSQVIGIDVGQRMLATVKTASTVKFFTGGLVCHKARQFTKVRKMIKAKGTRSSTRKLISLSKRERRFKHNVNHNIAKVIANANTVIGFEDLKDIRVSVSKKRRVGKRASVKQKKANLDNSKWAFAELIGITEYKAKLNNSIVIKVDPRYSSQECSKCGYTSKDNRPNGSKLFCCKACDYTVHSDFNASCNLRNRTILKRQDLLSSGGLSTSQISNDLDVANVDKELTKRDNPDETEDKELSYKPLTSVSGS